MTGKTVLHVQYGCDFFGSISNLWLVDGCGTHRYRGMAVFGEEIFKEVTEVKWGPIG